MGVPEQLKSYRLGRGLSVAELAEASGVSLPYIHQIESGLRQNPSGEKLQGLASALGITIADLIGAKEGISRETLDEAPESLREFVRRRGKRLDVRREDVEMLKRVHYRGKRPKSLDDWEIIFVLLRRILDQ